MNPSAGALEFEVTIRGDALYGDATLSVPPGPGSSALYELFYSPLVAGVTRGSIAFVNQLAGEFWYELTMTAEAPTPIELPFLRCAVGTSITHTFTISNPIGEELTLKLRNSNPANFSLASTTAQMALRMAPYADLEVVLAYTPSELDAEQLADISLSHPMLGEWLYVARGAGVDPGEMPPTEVTAALSQPTSGSISFRNPFDTAMMLTIVLERGSPMPGNAQSEPPFRLLRKSPTQLAQPQAVLQIPFAFYTSDMSEHAATLLVEGERGGRKLCWRFPLSGVAVSRPMQRPIQLQCRARQPLHKELALPIPGLEGGAGEEFTYELDVAPEHAQLLGRTLRLTPLQQTLSGTVVRMAVEWQPMRPVRSAAALVVQKASGGRWRYDLTLEARDPEPDDVITIEAALNKTSVVSFRLNNLFETEAAFSAYFTPESPSVFSVSPAGGMLAAASAQGTVFSVSYSPTEYGKLVRGTLVILTDDMQWSYDVRGANPVYEVPRVSGSRVDHQLNPNVSKQLGVAPRKNYLRDRAFAS
mmetsp:Transcript_1184/g.2413  ORF Transcript_1184/g.2413 Transcript_1184/m.2413 type:complete len:531 (-) Transcript_1184:271-1863(-)